MDFKFPMALFIGLVLVGWLMFLSVVFMSN